jgi:uncharacterized protein YeaO (DUF488 family)
MKLAQAATTPAQWSAFARKYRAEMAAPHAKHDLQLLAALSHRMSFSVGCYCEQENHCHRSILKQLLIENGAKIANRIAEGSEPSRHHGTRRTR